MKWFRLYVELLDDPKVQLLSDKEFRGLINVWCAYGKNEGKMPDIRSLAFSFRMPESSVSKLLEVLKNAGFIDSTDTGLEPHGWGKRQYISDVSTNRVNEFRERQRNRKRNDSETLQETVLKPVQIQSTDTEPPLPPKGEEKPDPLEEALKTTAETLTTRHPAVRSCGMKECQTLLKKIIAKDKGTAEKLAHLQRIDQNHRAQCETHDWQKNGGDYAKALNNWLAPTMGRYEVAPLPLLRQEEDYPF